MQTRWDLYCRVVDNFGDIGVCWRLARQLAADHGKQVRLWVDNPGALTPLCPAVAPGLPEQQVAGVVLRHWDTSLVPDASADVVIEAFACELPVPLVEAMARREPPPVWVNLEYLATEPWAAGCHGLASPHPRLPLVKYFFFPGFFGSTADVLRESGLRRPAPPKPLGDTATISLFCYDTAPVGDWLAALAAGPFPVHLRVVPGQPAAACLKALGQPLPVQRGQLTAVPQAFLPMDDYDPLLRSCDVNFVRGEDSFVRAQLAGRPFVWQAYRQADGAHLDKVNAFLARYCESLSPAAAEAVRVMFVTWNTEHPATAAVADAWHRYLAHHAELATHAVAWAEALFLQDDLATNLVSFCLKKV